MSLTNKLYKSRSVILDMLETRGYDVDKYRNFTINEIDVMNRNMSSKISSEPEPLDMIVEDGSKKLYLKYILNPIKIRIHAIMNIIEDIVPDRLEINNDDDDNTLDTLSETDSILKENDELIIIIHDKMTNTELLESSLAKYYLKNKIFIQVFWINSLQIKIVDHDFVPQHRVLNENEKNKLISNYNITSFNQLPIILQTDPIAKYYGMKRGDICEITRPSETSGQYIAYRYCM